MERVIQEAAPCFRYLGAGSSLQGPRIKHWAGIMVFVAKKIGFSE
jgi:hypothetical protein